MHHRIKIADKILSFAQHILILTWRALQKTTITYACLPQYRFCPVDEGEDRKFTAPPPVNVERQGKTRLS